MKSPHSALIAVLAVALIAMGSSVLRARFAQERNVRIEPGPGKELILGQKGMVVSVIGFSADSKSMAYLIWPYPNQGLTGRVVVIDSGTAREIQSFEMTALAGSLSPDGTTLALLVGDSVKAPRIELWDVGAGNKIRDFENPPQPHSPTTLAFVPDGKTVVSYIWGGPLHVWDPATGKVIRAFAESKGIIEHFAISSDGKYILAEHDEGDWFDYDPKVHKDAKSLRKGQVYVPKCTMRLWDMARGKGIVLAVQEDNFDLQPKGIGTWGRFSSTLGGPEHGFRIRVSTLGLIFFTPPCGKFPLQVRMNVNEERATWLLDFISGQKSRELKSPDNNAFDAITFSRDGHTLVACTFDSFASAGSRAVVVDMSDLLEKEKVRVSKLSPKELEALWADLANPDDRKSHIAMFSLTLLPEKQFATFFQKNVPTIKPIDPKHIAGWLVDLDSKAFAVREKAQTELEKLGKEVEPALREALKANPPLEPAMRMKQILEKVQNKAISGETARALRVLDILEHNRGPEARKLLDLLARGPADAWITEEAKISLGRLGK